jgi:hypothetical protein
VAGGASTGRWGTQSGGPHWRSLRPPVLQQTNGVAIHNSIMHVRNDAAATHSSRGRSYRRAGLGRRSWARRSIHGTIPTLSSTYLPRALNGCLVKLSPKSHARSLARVHLDVSRSDNHVQQYRQYEPTLC